MTDIKSGRGRVKSFDYVAPDVKVERFTPGPWHIDAGFESSKPGDFDEYWQVHDGADSIACSSNCYAENRKANAHLIAAAPDLYEALVSLIDSAEYLLDFAKEQCEFMGDVDEEQGFIDKSRAALAKARGES